MTYICRQMETTPKIQIIKSVLSEEKAGTFMTSLDVIQKVMNVPMCALATLLRANGYDNIDDTSSLCIDEKRLEIFAKAYVRKIRSYFISSLRNVSKLTPKELNNFKQFIELFKNQKLQREPSKWSDIDVNHLIEVFKEKVKKETPSKLSSFTSMLEDLFGSRIAERTRYTTLFSYLPNEPSYEVYSINDKFQRENHVLDAVTQSYYYIAKSTYVKQEWHINFLVRNIYIAARYHIFSTDSDDELNCKILVFYN